MKGLVDLKSGNYIKTTLNHDWDTDTSSHCEVNVITFYFGYKRYKVLSKLYLGGFG